MARKMKVFSGMVYRGGGYKCILATTTKKKACEILNLSNKELNDYWHCWEIDMDMSEHVKNLSEQALAQLETPLYCPDKDQFKNDAVYKKWDEIL